VPDPTEIVPRRLGDVIQFARRDPREMLT